jgi:MFS family permease
VFEASADAIEIYVDQRSGLAPTMTLMVMGRAMQGFGAGVLYVALYVIVGRVYPQELHPRVFAAFAAAWVLPSVIGPAIAGLLVQFVSWRAVFLGVVLLTIPSVFLVRPALRGISTPPSEQVRPSDDTRGRTPAAAAFFGAEAFVPLMMTTERGLSPALAGSALTDARLSPVEAQGANSSALQLADAMAVSSVLALGGALLARQGAAIGHETYLTCFAAGRGIGCDWNLGGLSGRRGPSELIASFHPPPSPKNSTRRRRSLIYMQPSSYIDHPQCATFPRKRVGDDLLTTVAVGKGPGVSPAWPRQSGPGSGKGGCSAR